MVPQSDELERVEFVDPALAALEQLPLLRRAELLVLAAQLVRNPYVDGECKFYAPNGRAVYYDGGDFLVYEPDPNNDDHWFICDFGPL